MTMSAFEESRPIAPPVGLSENARLAWDTLCLKQTKGIPSWLIHVMDIAYLERIAGCESGAYLENPDDVYLAFQRNVGACMIDQYLATNPMSMGQHGFESQTERTASTGAETVVLDGMVIDSCEAVVEHLERLVFPALRNAIAETDPGAPRAVEAIIAGERDMQQRIGPDFLKAPYGQDFGRFPHLRYTAYGYVNYLTAFAVYPDVMEQDFALQADLARRKNQLAAQAIVKGGLPRVVRLDHDMADSRGTLVDVRALDRVWFPHFQRAVEPYLDADIRLLWHCDGNLMEMVPRLIEAGVGGFQGFQYEDGMDYERICSMTTRHREPLMIWAGVSVTRTLPFGTPRDVRKELAWLVEHGPPVGLFLAGSSSITPGVPWENLDAFIEGLAHYRKHGRPA